MTRRGRTVWPIAVALASALALGACASDGDANRSKDENLVSNNGDDGPNQIGVNSFLWRAALDTLSFMPLASNDPFGGVIITDWRTDPNAPTERFKMTVYILDTRLRADGVKVNVFKQVNGVNGWVDAAVDPDTSLQIENAILTRARQLRLSTLGDN